MNLPPANTQDYINAKPFPHCIVDGVFNKYDLIPVIASWPKTHEHYTKNQFEVDKGSTLSEKQMGEYITDFIHINFQSQQFILWLEKLTGITGLVFDCRKFALHETFKGGSLKPHCDYTISKVTGLQLRVNVLLYLNEDWKPEYNGCLDLYDSKPMHGGTLRESQPAVSIEPLFNRMAIFTMSAKKDAWHGSSLEWKGLTPRRSIALNYFGLPQKNAVESRTIFSNERYRLRDFIPPIIYKLIK